MKELINQIGINLNEEQIEKFMKYKDMLKEWNEKVNLTAITKDEEIVLKHFADSLTIEKYIPANCKMIDVGTGAGFPGIPLGIVREDINVVLLDSLKKRINFLSEVKKELSLNNINIVEGRAEDIAKTNDNREKYDIVTARAVASLNVLAEYCIPFIKIGGIFICMKGSNIDEIKEAKNAIQILGGELIDVKKVILPDSDIERNIIMIKKIKNTPNEYPRRAGIPTKKPIK